MSTTLSLPKETEATQTVGQNHKCFNHWSLRLHVSGEFLVVWIWFGFDVKLSSRSKIMSWIMGKWPIVQSWRNLEHPEFDLQLLKPPRVTSTCNNLSWKHGTGVMSEICTRPLWKMTPWQPKILLRVRSSFMSCFRVQIKLHFPSFSSLKELLYM